jgi:hypothetical protein
MGSISVDIRGKEDATVLKLGEALKKHFVQIATGEDVGGLSAQVDWQLDTDSPATRFHENCIKGAKTSEKDLPGANAGGT